MRRPVGLVVTLAVAAACSGSDSGSDQSASTTRATVDAAATTVASTAVAETTAAPPPGTDPTPTAATSPPVTQATGPGPDLIVHDAVVWTMDAERSIAQAVAITGGDIVAVGTDVDVLALAGSGTVVVDAGGRMIVPGIVEPHTHLVQSPAPDLDGMRAGQAELLRLGITTAGMPSVDREELEAFRELDASGEIWIRSFLYVLYNTVCGDVYDGLYQEVEFSLDPDQRLAVAGTKVFADGGVCAAPAVSFEYLPTTPERLRDAGWTGHGVLYVSADEIAGVISDTDARGGQVVVHAIGDVGIETALRGHQAARDGGLERRHRIDHNSFAALLDVETRELYTSAQVLPVVQLIPWSAGCESRSDEVWQSILPPDAVAAVERRDAILAANPDLALAWHGDAPSVPESPLAQAYGAVTGGAADGFGTVCSPQSWGDRPTSTVVEALAMLTIDAAAAMLIDGRVGSLEPGKAADLLVLAEPLDHPDPAVGIADNRSLVTIADGVVRFCEGDLCEPLAALMR